MSGYWSTFAEFGRRVFGFLFARQRLSPLAPFSLACHFLHCGSALCDQSPTHEHDTAYGNDPYQSAGSNRFANLCGAILCYSHARVHATGAKLGRYAANGESNGASDAYDDSADYPVLSGDCARHVPHESHLGGDGCDRILIFALEKGR
jgi:hypothetical protein